ncbi:hypothetical protein FA95DRAFT_314467 [Auriscalpium vulgare]|uniref:Uncharacterized protein n=1 Tax=Auriscalpium vulgare TaxID=40419 RepID=A0ACB8S601_9AGAM|nr:hypothetical protein FA95DRAFT_314467 [Auriscalpium vulgare]
MPDHQTQGTPVAALLKTVFGSIIQVFLVCLAGYLLARKGILDKKTQKQFNHVNITLFTPCLVFSKVAFSLSREKLKELWIIPLFFIAVSVVSAAVAYSLGRVFRLKPSQRNFAIASAMFMNSNSLPIALLQSLVVAVPGLHWGDDDTKDAMLGRALTYLLLCSTLGMILRWSIGVRLLTKADPAEEQLAPAETGPRTGRLIDIDNEEDEQTPDVPAIVVNESQGPHQDVDSRIQRHREHSSHPKMVFYSFPNSPTGSTSNLASDDDASDQATDVDSDDDELPHSFRRAAPPPTRMQRAKRRIASAFRAFNSFMTAPLWASLISLLVAFIPPLQHALEVHLHPIKGAVTQAGNCSIPVTLIVLGGYFYRPADPAEKGRGGLKGRWRRAKARESFTGSVRELLSLNGGVAGGAEGLAAGKRADNSKGEGKTVLVAIASRMLITPALFLPFMILGAARDIPPVFEDPVFVLSLVLLLSSPPALTLSQITQAASGDAFERLISSTIFWSYCVLTPPATVGYSVIAMIIAHI